MRFTILITTAFVLFSSSVFAKSDIDRLTAAFKVFEKKYTAIYEAKAPDLVELLPKTLLDDEYGAALQCFLDKLESDQGREGVEKYLSGYEAFVEQDLVSLKQIGDAPQGFETNKLLKVNKQCGILELTQKRMKESGYDKIYSDPELLKQLSDLFSEE